MNKVTQLVLSLMPLTAISLKSKLIDSFSRTSALKVFLQEVSIQTYDDTIELHVDTLEKGEFLHEHIEVIGDKLYTVFYTIVGVAPKKISIRVNGLHLIDFNVEVYKMYKTKNQLA